MVLNTSSIPLVHMKDNTPEYEVGIDSEGKGFLRKKKIEEVKIEEPIVEEEKPKTIEEVLTKKTKKKGNK